MLKLPSGIIFLLTAGLPIVVAAILIGIEVFIAINGASVDRTTSDQGATWVIMTWLAGFLFLQLWALSATIQLRKKLDNQFFFSRAALFFGLLSFLVLIFTYYLGFTTINTPEIKASESLGGLSSIDSSQKQQLILILLLVAWFAPRFLFFGLLARILTLLERTSRWLPTMLLFLLWPIGIWFLQPRIRQQVLGRKELTVEEHLV